MPTITIESLLREIEEKNDRIRELETALHNSTDLLKLNISTIENLYDANYVRQQIANNQSLLGLVRS